MYPYPLNKCTNMEIFQGFGLLLTLSLLTPNALKYTKIQLPGRFLRFRVFCFLQASCFGLCALAFGGVPLFVRAVRCPSVPVQSVLVKRCQHRIHKSH